jgi:lysozyme
MTPKQAGAGIAAILAACACIAPNVVEWEGWKTRSYTDSVGVTTGCAGVTKGIVKGKVYTDRDCLDLTTRALVDHGVAIDRCLPGGLPVQVRAAFTSTAYNIGVANFCGSSMARLATAGDLKGACAALDRWVYAGGEVLPGLVKRRAAERAYCEEGLKP